MTYRHCTAPHCTIVVLILVFSVILHGCVVHAACMIKVHDWFIIISKPNWGERLLIMPGRIEALPLQFQFHRCVPVSLAVSPKAKSIQ
jgi:hypothetical protein